MLKVGDKVNIVSSTFLDGTICMFTSKYIGKTAVITSILVLVDGIKYYVDIDNDSVCGLWFSGSDLEKIIDIDYEKLPIGTILYDRETGSSVTIDGYNDYNCGVFRFTPAYLENVYTTEKPEVVEMTIAEIAEKLNISVDILRIKE